MAAASWAAPRALVVCFVHGGAGCLQRSSIGAHALGGTVARRRGTLKPYPTATAKLVLRRRVVCTVVSLHLEPAQELWLVGVAALDCVRIWIRGAALWGRQWFSSTDASCLSSRMNEVRLENEARLSYDLSRADNKQLPASRSERHLELRAMFSSLNNSFGTGTLFTTAKRPECCPRPVLAQCSRSRSPDGSGYNHLFGECAHVCESSHTI